MSGEASPGRVRLAWALLSLQLLIPALIVAKAISKRQPEISQTDPTVSVLRIDDYFHFWSAGKAMLNGGDVFSPEHGRNYIYPPLMAWIFQIFGAFEQRPSVYIWLGIDAILLGAGVVILARELARRLEIPGGWHTVLLACIISLACLLDKVMGQFKLQQTDGIMLLAMALALKWLDKRPILAGIILGFAGNIKYLSLIAVPWFGIRKRWAAMLSTILSFAGFLILPAITRGWDRNTHDLKVAFAGLVEAFGVNLDHVTRASSHPITWERSVSVTSTFFRLTERFSLGSPVAVVLIGSVAAGCVGLAWFLYARRAVGFWTVPATNQGVIGMEWVGLVVASLVFGPQTTTRHLIQLVALFVLASLFLVNQSRNPLVSSRWPLVLAGAAVTLALVLPPGGAQFESALNTWRAVGGSSWCALIFLFLTLDHGLKFLQTRSTRLPLG